MINLHGTLPPTPGKVSFSEGTVDKLGDKYTPMQLGRFVGSFLVSNFDSSTKSTDFTLIRNELAQGLPENSQTEFREGVNAGFDSTVIASLGISKTTEVGNV